MTKKYNVAYVGEANRIYAFGNPKFEGVVPTDAADVTNECIIAVMNYMTKAHKLGVSTGRFNMFLAATDNGNEYKDWLAIHKNYLDKKEQKNNG